MDATAVEIAIGLAAAIAHASLAATRQRKFDLQTTLSHFFAGVAVPAGLILIYCALKGSRDALPADWRVSVAVAGIAMAGLSGHLVVTGLHAASVRAPEADAEDEDEDEELSDDDQNNAA